MERKRRLFLCIGAVAALLLSIAVTGVAVAQPEQKGSERENIAKAVLSGGARGESHGAMKEPNIVVHTGHGFALNEDGSFHVLRINALRVRRINPSDIRALIGGDKSIEDIRAEVEKGNPFYRGHMRLGEYHYRLDNLSVTETNGDRRFDANVVGPLRELADTNRIVGIISITVMRHEGIWIGDGELAMTEGEYEGKYRVLLDMLPPRQRR
ncbi:hypothetical protein C5S39_04955 [Candidatus Methanophagaceae archaeon]|nr:hypothetical protein C5S39_04955 [Methanophagales archaeon]